jgi:hypothetical protein
MKQNTFKIGIVVMAIGSIASAASAQSIANGDYGDVYGSGHVVQVSNNKFRFLIDQPDAPTPWRSVSKAGFKPIKSGVFYDPSDRTYYCNISMTNPKKRTPARCTRNGWR